MACPIFDVTATIRGSHIIISIPTPGSHRDQAEVVYLAGLADEHATACQRLEPVVQFNDAAAQIAAIEKEIGETNDVVRMLKSQKEKSMISGRVESLLATHAELQAANAKLDDLRQIRDEAQRLLANLQAAAAKAISYHLANALHERNKSLSDRADRAAARTAKALELIPKAIVAVPEIANAMKILAEASDTESAKFGSITVEYSVRKSCGLPEEDEA